MIELNTLVENCINYEENKKRMNDLGYLNTEWQAILFSFLDVVDYKVIGNYWWSKVVGSESME